MENSHDRRQSPLYKKSEQIFKLTHALIEIIPQDKEFFKKPAQNS
jgi:hypothetical protein